MKNISFQYQKYSIFNPNNIHNILESVWVYNIRLLILWTFRGYSRTYRIRLHYVKEASNRACPPGWRNQNWQLGGKDAAMFWRLEEDQWLHHWSNGETGGRRARFSSSSHTAGRCSSRKALVAQRSNGHSLASTQVSEWQVACAQVGSVRLGARRRRHRHTHSFWFLFLLQAVK